MEGGRVSKLCRLLVWDWELGIGNWDLGIGNWELGIGIETVEHSWQKDMFCVVICVKLCFIFSPPFFSERARH